mmetsp:Transcript_9577/g.28938  ORF Transcript_9577/g.28938 Transcript_9577/m.28938 type:complete len:1092 (+) Transcript_9577:200-3475(+)|eukprot:CAMPEP_0198735600 /NCGR_PEP_ID=MMETSP1475-20131203/60751_1 /TAXON_ID= ORGANISM="Unidentified sp., Strain CCMP1999" /NCGR_SAMPLE_ID=MMETSP1475 /ASSEMBLY_ACC=CAM_ASM_001111 /LENGTH=1091 /DNA_ID=CAMNT_0044499287 /DNA_START=118 /DNA_END=3393 /DNA_ORIENTATION=-
MKWFQRSDSGDGQRNNEAQASDSSAAAAPAGSANPSTKEDMMRRRMARFEAAMKAQKAATETPAEVKDTVMAEPAEPAKVAAPKPDAKIVKREEAEPEQKPRPNKVAKPKASVEVLISQTLSRVLGVSLDKETPGMVFMEDFAKEMREEDNLPADKPILVTGENAERILFERITKYPDPIAFLIESFERSEEELRRTKIDQIGDSLRSTQDFLVLFTGLVMTSPQDFVSSGADTLDVVDYFVNRLCAGTIPPALFSKLLKKLEEDEDTAMLNSLLDSIFSLLTSRASSTNISTPQFAVPLARLAFILSHKTAAQHFVKHARFLSKDQVKSPSDLETRTFLGSLFRNNLADDKLRGQLFPDPQNLPGMEIVATLQSLRDALAIYWKHLHEIVMCLFRAGPEAREATLDWFSHVAKLNEDRQKMHFDPKTVSSDGFMLNVDAVLLKVCEPFLDPKSAKLKGIDPTYVLSSHRVADLEDTKLGMPSGLLEKWVDPRNEDCQQQFRQTQQLSEEELRRSAGARVRSTTKDIVTVSSSFGFVTETFYLTAKLIVLGFNSVSSAFEKLLTHIKRGKEELQRLEQMNIPNAAFIKHRISVQLSSWMSTKLALEAYLVRNENMLPMLIRFSSASASYLMNLFSEGEPLELPLTIPPAPGAAIQPEYLIDNVVQIMIFGIRFDVDTVDNNLLYLENLLSLCIVVMNSPLHVRNPYLRSQFAELLWYFAPRSEEGNSPNGPVQQLFESSAFARKHLMTAAFRLYVDVETTGSHTQFYDKFNTRFFLSDIMLELWRDERYKESLREVAQKESRLLQKLINLLLNDANYLLEHCLDELQETYNIQVSMDNPTEWQSLSPDEQREKQERLDSLEQQIKTYLRLALSSLKLMEAFASDETMREVFLRPEMVLRTAEMMNYYLQQLVGPRCQELNVKNREELGWEPRVFLTKIMKIYLYLHSSGRFAQEIAKDKRSFSRDIFKKAISISRRRHLLAYNDLEGFQKLLQEVEKEAALEEEDEDILGDVPDEFLDPIMSTLMTDPVILPTSNETMDRQHIERHLLNQLSDPFNRKALTVDQLIPNEELKKRIDEYIAKQKSEPHQTGL